MINYLKLKDVITLSFMIFALFVGAGNIIFPPMVGLQERGQVWVAAIGFLFTAVGLPVLTVISLVKVGGSIENLSSPIGKLAGMLLAIICNLTVGPLFAAPRAATVSFEVGVAPLVRDSALTLFIYSVIYFSIVVLISLYPFKLLNTIGNFLAPLKIIALALLSLTAVIYPIQDRYDSLNSSSIINVYNISAFANGFVNGYLTMDTIGAMVFSIVIFNAVRSRGIIEDHLIINYTTLASIIAGLGLTLLYLALFHLGSSSTMLVNKNANGAVILYAYVHTTFGITGIFLLSVLFFLSCLVTTIGLTSACAEFFAKYLPFSYKTLVFLLSILSMLISNIGLKHLIQISIPVLTIIYPPCIVLVILSFTKQWWNNYSRIITLTMLVSLFFGMIEGIKISSFSKTLPESFLSCTKKLPLSEQGISWLVPTIIVMIILIIWDRKIKD